MALDGKRDEIKTFLLSRAVALCFPGTFRTISQQAEREVCRLSVVFQSFSSLEIPTTALLRDVSALGIPAPLPAKAPVGEQRLSSAQGHQDGRFALQILNTSVILVLQLGRTHPYPYADGCSDRNTLVLVQE